MLKIQTEHNITDVFKILKTRWIVCLSFNTNIFESEPMPTPWKFFGQAATASKL